MIILWIMSLGKENHRGKFPFSSQHVKGTYCQHDITSNVDLDQLAQGVIVRFLDREINLLSHFPLLSSLEVTLWSLYLKGWGVSVPLP